MKYYVIDVETANPDYSSICQIGLVEISGTQIIDEVRQFIDPCSYFDPFNTSIHGISAGDVIGQPTFAQFIPDLAEMLNDAIVVHHGHFDRTAFNRASQIYETETLSVKWLDSTKIVRRTWPEFSSKGYGLSNLASFFDYQFEHHDALEDAKFTQFVVSKAIKASGLDLEAWLKRVEQPISGSSASSFSRTGQKDETFSGSTIVFTGSLKTPRRDAADIAQQLGFDVTNSVTKSTTHLCVGLQYLDKLNGYKKSSKQRKAEQLITRGQDLTILSESDFWAMAEDIKGI